MAYVIGDKSRNGTSHYVFTTKGEAQQALRKLKMYAKKENNSLFLEVINNLRVIRVEDR